MSLPLGGRKTIWTASRYAVLNLTRWTMLAGMLVFLLSAILALHEALNFQDRVLELAGNDLDRARRVLGVLHDTVENPDRYPEDRELPYAAIAVKLDRLSKVQETLTGFTMPPAEAEADTAISDERADADPPPADAADADARADAGSAGAIDGQADRAGGDAAAQWQAASNRLKLSIADLDDTLKTGDPARRLLEALHHARRHIRTLAAFRGSIPSSDDGTMMAPGAAHAAPRPTDSRMARTASSCSWWWTS
ncbi:MAG: hypothetical protein HC871_02360 [Rhizobiales bacterium]|nr:hypothetical protein [Hyphomicrobiales bacterium]